MRPPNNKMNSERNLRKTSVLDCLNSEHKLTCIIIFLRSPYVWFKCALIILQARIFVNMRHVKSIMCVDRILVIKEDIVGGKIHILAMYFYIENIRCLKVKPF